MTFRRPVLWISILLAAMSLAAMYWVAAPIFSNPFTTATKAKFVSSDNMSARHLVSMVWVESVSVYGDTDVRIDLDFENHSGRTADLQSIQIQAPGFEETGPCWQDHHPACLAEGNGSRVPMPATLQAGKSMHVYAKLKSHSAGRFGILAVYRWAESGAGGDSNAKGAAPESYTRAVSLDPILVTTRSREVLTRVGEVLTVSVLLALAAPLWQWMMKRHDERYQEREAQRQLQENERETQRQMQENEREKEFQVWKEQVARVFEYTQQHYLHITRSIRGLDESVKKTREGDAGYRERVFYHFLMFRIHMRILKDKRGGWFLMTSDAEQVLSMASFLLWNRFDANLNAERLDTVVSRLRAPLSLAKYREACKPASELSEAAAEFLTWMDVGHSARDAGDSFNGCLSLMNLMRIVLQFEWNRPFVEYWYKKKPDFAVTQFREFVGNMPVVPPKDVTYTDVREKLAPKASDYADSVEKYLRDVKY